MGNMSYCRFENTYKDLRDCDDNMNNEPESESERKYYNLLIKLCKKIADDFSD
jgi:hypothetical protein